MAEFLRRSDQSTVKSLNIHPALTHATNDPPCAKCHMELDSMRELIQRYLEGRREEEKGEGGGEKD